jgi:hypothetical protein
VEGAVRLFGAEYCGLLTIGCPGNDRLKDAREFSKRLDSFNANLMSGRFVQWLAVIQRHKSGVLHVHIFVVASWEIGYGAYWNEKRRQWCCQPTRECEDEWEVFNPKRMLGFGLGVANLMPMQGDPAALGRYLGRYLGRELGTRRKEDRGVKLVRYSQSWHRVVYGPFSAADYRSLRARERAEDLSKRLWGSFGNMVRDVGPKWKWHLRRTLYAGLGYDQVVCSTKADLEYFDGPLFALDAQWAAFDRPTEKAREDFSAVFV